MIELNCPNECIMMDLYTIKSIEIPFNFGKSLWDKIRQFFYKIFNIKKYKNIIVPDVSSLDIEDDRYLYLISLTEKLEEHQITKDMYSNYKGYILANDTSRNPSLSKVKWRLIDI